MAGYRLKFTFAFSHKITLTKAASVLLMLQHSELCARHFSHLRSPMSASTHIPLVKVKLKVKFTPEQAIKAQRWGRGVAVFFL
jgi:hypothetical protein